MKKLPKIRENLLVQELKDEVLIYDKSTNKSYCLNETAKIVFNACDGKKTFIDLNLPEDVIYLSLDELKKQNLIQDDYTSPFVGMSRRDAVRKVGLTSMVALPSIIALAAPKAAQAASTCRQDFETCNFDGTYSQSNCCTNLRCLVTGTCFLCAPSNAPYTSFGFQPDQATCNQSPERNLCCNPAATPAPGAFICNCG